MSTLVLRRSFFVILDLFADFFAVKYVFNKLSFGNAKSAFDFFVGITGSAVNTVKLRAKAVKINSKMYFLYLFDDLLENLK